MRSGSKSDITLFLHGRPKAHDMHQKMAAMVSSYSMVVDPVIRWQDKNLFLPIRIIAWILNALYFTFLKKEQIIFIEGIHITGILIRFFSFNRKKVISLVADQTLYFIYSDYFKSYTKKLLLFTLKNFHAIIFIGKMGQEIFYLLPLNLRPPNTTTFAGVPAQRQKLLESISPDLNAHKILLIAAGWHGWRFWYKGLDLMIKAFNIAADWDETLTFTIIGYWPEEIQNSVCQGIIHSNRIEFIGRTEDLSNSLMSSSLYLHCARGDAFPVAVLESMTAGLPALISEWTGSREFIGNIDKNFITPLNENEIADKINWYMNLPIEQKMILSDKFRKYALNYTEENSLNDFNVAFTRLLGNMNKVVA